VIKEKSGEKYRKWLKKEMKAFNKSLHEKKKERRLQKQRPYFNALQTFNTIMDEIYSFDKAIQKILRKIEKKWEKFRASISLKAHPPPATA